MLRIQIPTAAPPRTVRQALEREAERDREPAVRPRKWRRAQGRVQIRIWGQQFRIAYEPSAFPSETPLPELRGTVVAAASGGTTVHATCGYGMRRGRLEVVLLLAALVMWVVGIAGSVWLAGLAAVSFLLGKARDRASAARPVEYTRYLVQRLDAALAEAAAPERAGTASASALPAG